MTGTPAPPPDDPSERSGGDLQPLTPRKAVELYMDDRRAEVRTETARTHRSGLDLFVDWTDEAGIENMNVIDGRQLLRFKQWRKETTDLALISLYGTLAVVRRFLRFCEQIDAVRAGVADAVPMPNVPDEQQISTDVPSDEQVERIREYVGRYEYASRRHVEFELVREVGLRRGAVRGIDLQDYDAERRLIELRHRPEGDEEHGTPLKNGRAGERRINISSDLQELLDDYVADTRTETTDRFDRTPLFTTAKGRVTRTTITRDFYKMFRPCVVTNECPHDRELESCRARKSAHASTCPSSYSPHPLRRWSIMHQLDQGVRKELLSDRVDVSVPVLEKHYDQRSAERKRRQRRRELAESLSEYETDDSGR